jgi:16S rRNA (guanine527-N7)-methyltransferase
VSELASRLVDLAQRSRVVLDERQLGQLEDYLRLLARWNATINLTALPLDGFPDGTLDRLVTEALLAARFMPPLAARPEAVAKSDRQVSWFDLGSGGGSPALPLKIVRPDLRLTMVESRERKSAFLREAVRVLQLPQADVRTTRIEEVVAVNIDIITVRAISWTAVLAGAVSRMLALDGRALLFGSSVPELAGLELQADVPLVSAGDRLFVLKRST